MLDDINDIDDYNNMLEYLLISGTPEALAKGLVEHSKSRSLYRCVKEKRAIEKLSRPLEYKEEVEDKSYSILKAVLCPENEELAFLDDYERYFALIKCTEGSAETCRRFRTNRSIESMIMARVLTFYEEKQ